MFHHSTATFNSVHCIFDAWGLVSVCILFFCYQLRARLGATCPVFLFFFSLIAPSRKSLGSYLAPSLSSYLPISLSILPLSPLSITTRPSSTDTPPATYQYRYSKNYLLCFLKWPRLSLTKNVPNCSPCARIAGRQPLLSGAEMSWAPFSATHAVFF